MDRPRLIVHTVASADGRVSLGPDRSGFEDAADPRWLKIWSSEISLEESVRGLESRYHPQVFLEGSGSFVREHDPLDELPAHRGDASSLYHDYLPASVVRRVGRRGWFAAVDGRGRLRSGMKEFPGWDGWHTLHLTSRGAPPEYLAHLRRREIPYLVAGERSVDLPLIMYKLKTSLGVERVVCTAGSKLNGALLRAGLVDEISLVLLPAIIGGTQTPILFRSPDLTADEPPVSLSLLSVESEPGGRVHLRYAVSHMTTEDG